MIEICDTNALSETPLVSVLIVTYNQENFIEQCILSAIAQSCSFDLEILVCDDTSKDGTLDICIGLQRRFPNMIRVCTGDKNVGIGTNYLRGFHLSRGTYVATLEGDDFWTDPKKLEKQLKALEKRPDISLCGARTKIINEGNISGPKKQIIGPRWKFRGYCLSEAISTPIFHTSSCVYRKDKIIFSQRFAALSYVDLYLQCVSVMNGIVVGIPDIVSSYRWHQGGVYIGADAEKHCDRWEAVYDALLEVANGRDKEIIKRGYGIVNVQRCHVLMGAGQYTKARKRLKQIKWPFAAADLLPYVIVVLRVRYPRLYCFARDGFRKVGLSKYLRLIVSR